MRDVSEITPRQTRILEVLWRTGGATTAEVQEALAGDRELARTTVATKLARMESYGWLTREREGREFRYRAAVGRSQLRSARVRSVMASLFTDDLPSLVSHALESGDWEEDDLERVEAMLEAYRCGGEDRTEEERA